MYLPFSLIEHTQHTNNETKQSDLLKYIGMYLLGVNYAWYIV